MRSLGADALRELRGVGVAEIDADAKRDDGEENAEVSADVVGDAMDGSVRAEGEGDNDAAGASRDGEGERVEDFLFKSAVGVLRDFALGAVGRGVLLIEEGPTHGGENEASGDLHDGQGDTEEVQDGSANHFDDEQEDCCANGDLESELFEDGGWGVADEAKEDECRADGVDDGEQGAEGEAEELGERGEGRHGGGRIACGAGVGKSEERS